VRQSAHMDPWTSLVKTCDRGLYVMHRFRGVRFSRKRSVSRCWYEAQAKSWWVVVGLHKGKKNTVDAWTGRQQSLVRRIIVRGSNQIVSSTFSEMPKAKAQSTSIKAYSSVSSDGRPQWLLTPALNYLSNR